MSDRAKAVLTALLDLPPDERQYVLVRTGDGADKDEEFTQEEWDAAWEAEIVKRVSTLRSGAIKGIPGEEVMARLKAKYER